MPKARCVLAATDGSGFQVEPRQSFGSLPFMKKPTGVVVVVVAVLLAGVAVFWIYRTTAPPPSEIQLACIGTMKADACPVGAALDASTFAGQDCSAAGEGSVERKGGKVTGVCGFRGECKYMCRPVPGFCPHGVKTLTATLLECNAAPPL